MKEVRQKSQDRSERLESSVQSRLSANCLILISMINCSIMPMGKSVWAELNPVTSVSLRSPEKRPRYNILMVDWSKK